MKKKFLFVFIIPFLFLVLNSQSAFAAYCGDSSCDAGENPCNCATDCGSCPSGQSCIDGYCQVPTLKFACEDCTPSLSDPCYSYYSSGSNCYYGVSCKNVHTGSMCLSYTSDTASPTEYNCYKAGVVQGYAYMDDADPRTDVQCQDKSCGSSGWSIVNKADGTACTYNGFSSACKSGVCQSACSGGISIGSCCDTEKKCKLVGTTLSCAADSSCNVCTKDVNCFNKCKANGCDLEKWDCVSNVCSYTNTFSSCSADYTCAGASSCYVSTGSCTGNGGGGGFDFSMSASPSSGSVQQGNSTTTTATATLVSGTSQSVTLSCSGLPTGASCSFSPSSVSPTASSTLTISTAATTPTGTYSVTISGTGGGLTRTASYSLTVTADATPPSVSVTGAPSSWQYADASAGVSCSDSGSGCDSGTYRLKTYSSNPGSCSNTYADYTLAQPQTISSHVWVCAAAKDNAGNAGFSAPVEFLVDQIPPQVNPYGIPFSPCNADPAFLSFNADPAINWIDCSATASLSTSGSKGCQDADSGCNPSSYGFIKYYAQPASCPSAKSSYSSKAPQLENLSWVCGYAEDNVGNAAVSGPTKFMVNRTFVIEINALAYGEIEVPVGTEVKGYLCDPSQYYCNQDAAYLAGSSGIVGADKRFRITFVRELVRGTKYKIGLQTEKGYAESEFTA